MVTADKVALTFRAEVVKVRELDALAVYQDRDRSYVLNQAIDALLELHRWQVDETRKALDEVEAGEYLTDEQFRAEVARWPAGGWSGPPGSPRTSSASTPTCGSKTRRPHSTSATGSFRLPLASRPSPFPAAQA